MIDGLPPEVRAVLVGRRQAIGWTPSELARALRCSRSFIGKVESGERVPLQRTLDLWCQVLTLDDESRALLEAMRDCVR